MEHNFIHQSNDSKELLEIQILQYKDELETMRDLFRFGLDLRVITQENIDVWEKELRTIISGIGKLGTNPLMQEFLRSSDTILHLLDNAIVSLYIASDIHQKVNPSIKDRQIYYVQFRECSSYISQALNCINI